MQSYSMSYNFLVCGKNKLPFIELFYDALLENYETAYQNYLEVAGQSPNLLFS